MIAGLRLQGDTDAASSHTVAQSSLSPGFEIDGRDVSAATAGRGQIRPSKAPPPHHRRDGWTAGCEPCSEWLVVVVVVVVVVEMAIFGKRKISFGDGGDDGLAVFNERS
ncbi:hypothetical protein NL676_035799 [Syzygium grande]|nr:hypothetical protein NL676_035799 [Syzygium grande]